MWKDLIDFNSPYMYTMVGFSTGYFLYDLADMLVNDGLWKSWDVALHHVAVSYTMSYLIAIVVACCLISTFYVSTYICGNVLCACVGWRHIFLQCHYRAVHTLYGYCAACRDQQLFLAFTQASSDDERLLPVASLPYQRFLQHHQLSHLPFPCQRRHLCRHDCLGSPPFPHLHDLSLRLHDCYVPRQLHSFLASH